MERAAQALPAVFARVTAAKEASIVDTSRSAKTVPLIGEIHWIFLLILALPKNMNE